MLNSFFPSVIESGKRSRYLDGETARKADEWMSSFTSMFVGSTIRGGEPTRLLGKLDESRCNSMLREREEEIIRLK